MIKMFIERPVLSTVVSIIIVILGVLGLMALPVTQYPEVAPPTVQVSASYTGASAETVMKSVVVPLEEQINGVEGMDYITSTANNNGTATITVYFKQGVVDPDIAAVNVQNRVSRATPLLPAEVTRAGVTTQKQQTDALMYMGFYSENPNIDETYIQNYLNINIIPALKRITGVADASIFGGKNYSMRVWLDPQKMAAYGLVPSDISAVLAEQSMEAAAGSLGQNAGNSFEYVIKYKGRFNEENEYGDIIVKAIGNGQYLRLKDVAKIEMGSLTYSTKAERGDNPSVNFGIFQTPGSNAQTVIKEIHQFLKDNESNLPPGMKYSIHFDSNEFLEASISNVVTTLVEAFILVFVVVYLFLQDLRSTVIPAIAAAVSLIGTFFILNLLGYSLNLLTLFALVLAIGIVVDDAIVVVEAVHAKLEADDKLSAKQATVKAMSEISGAIITITMVMGAVFIPVSFISGSTGVFYQQFGITMVIAIFISALNALTLSPVLCALLLKGGHSEEVKDKNFIQRFFHKFNIAFNAVTEKYVRVVGMIVKNKWIAALALILSAGIIYWSNSQMPSGFVPNEDRGMILVNADLATGASLERTYKVMKEVQQKVKQIEGVDDMTIISGTNLFSGAGSNNGLGFVRLKSFDDRGGDPESVKKILGQLYATTAGITDANVLFFPPPSVPGFGMGTGVSFNLLDKTGADSKTLNENTQTFLQQLMARPEIMYAQTSFNTNYPQYEMLLNVPKIKESGITVNAVLSVLQGYIGGYYSNDFIKYGKQFRVMAQALPNDRADTSSLDGIYVRTGDGQMTPVSQFVTLERVYGPQSVNRYNLYNSVSINGSNAEGYSTGDAIRAVQEVAKEHLPSGYDIDFTGLSREEMSAGSQTIIVFALSLLFTYFFLSAQYESYMLPFAVILSLPIGIMGAFVGQYFAGLENNIYFQIALIMLVGLLAKNAILIVEFALQRRQHGDSLTQAAMLAARDRLRPILMTSFAFILGLVPLTVS